MDQIQRAKVPLRLSWNYGFFNILTWWKDYCEVKNSAKAKLLSFNKTDGFLYEVKLWTNDILKAR